MKKIAYSKVDELLKELTVFFSSLLFLLFFTTFLVAQDFSHREIVTNGRAVIIDNDANSPNTSFGLAEALRIDDSGVTRSLLLK